MGPKSEPEKQKGEFVTGISILVQNVHVKKASEAITEPLKTQHCKHRIFQYHVFYVICTCLLFICNIHLECYRGCDCLISI